MLARIKVTSSSLLRFRECFRLDVKFWMARTQISKIRLKLSELRQLKRATNNASHLQIRPNQVQRAVLAKWTSSKATWRDLSSKTKKRTRQTWLRANLDRKKFASDRAWLWVRDQQSNTQGKLQTKSRSMKLLAPRAPSTRRPMKVWQRLQLLHRLLKDRVGRATRESRKKILQHSREVPPLCLKIPKETKIFSLLRFKPCFLEKILPSWILRRSF